MGCIWVQTKVQKYISIFQQVFVVVILLMGEIFGRLICQTYADINEWIWIFRSALLYGIPFVSIGRLVRQYENRILERFTMKICSIGGILFYLLAFTEYIVLKQYLDVYASTVLLSVAIFVFALYFKYTKNMKLICWIGRNLSGNMYLLHLPCIEIIEQFDITSK